MKLTDTKCRNAKPFDLPSKTPRKLADGHGLYLWVMPNGAKYWRFAYRINEKQKTQAFGVYPEISLIQARKKRSEARKIIENEHFAAIDTKELPTFIHAIDRNDARLYRNTQNALRLIMLTFVRTSELINARWEEMDFEIKEWTIPAERMKMGKEHIVPLSRQAIAILENQKKIAGQWPLVFPSNVRPRQSTGHL